MVKFVKNKLKALNKITKKQKQATGSVSKKILKKKINIENKVTFQNEVLPQIRADVANSPLVRDILREIKYTEATKTSKKPSTSVQKKPKVKPVKKQKQRQKTQISDTKLLFNLIKKK